MLRVPFRKTAACPTSAALISFRTGVLPAEIAMTIREHLDACDFCCAELGLLAHHRPPTRNHKTPEIPIDLRILAESILLTADYADDAD